MAGLVDGEKKWLVSLSVDHRIPRVLCMVVSSELSVRDLEPSARSADDVPLSNLSRNFKSSCETVFP